MSVISSNTINSFGNYKPFTKLNNPTNLKQVVLTKIDNKINIGNFPNISNINGNFTSPGFHRRDSSINKSKDDILFKKHLSFSQLKEIKQDSNLLKQNSMKIIPTINTKVNHSDKFPFFINNQDKRTAIDLAENHKSGNLLHGGLKLKDKKYLNENEILIINKKPNISYVRGILSPDERVPNWRRNESKCADDFYTNENYNFNISANFKKENFEKNLNQNMNIKFNQNLNKNLGKKLTQNNITLIRSKSALDIDFDKYIYNEDTKYLKKKENKKVENSKSKIEINHSYSNSIILNLREEKKQINNDNIYDNLITPIDTAIKREEYYEGLKKYVKHSDDLYIRRPSKELSLRELMIITPNNIILESLKFDKNKIINEKIRTRRMSYLVDKIKINENLPMSMIANKEFIPEDVENRELHFHEKEELYKNKIIVKFLNKIKVTDFISQIHKHRRIYIILDGSFVLNNKQIPGRLVDIPTKRFFDNISSKKDRMKIYYDFLKNCSKLYPTKRKFKSLFLKNNNPIFDLNEIPEDDKFIFISDKDVMTGIKIVQNKEKIKIISKLKEDKKNDQIKLSQDLNKVSYIKKLLFNKNLKDLNKSDYTEQFEKYISIKKIRKYNKNLNKSFSDYRDNENDEWFYPSESEDNKKLHYDYIKSFKESSDLIIYFTEFAIDFKTKLIKNRIYNKSKFVPKNESEDLISDFNMKSRKKQRKIALYMKKKKLKGLRKKIPPENIRLMEGTIEIMRRFVENLGIFYYNKGDDNDIEDFLIKFKKDEELHHVHKNKSAYDNTYFRLNREVDKVYPNLFHFNIPKLLELYPQFDRKELYELFVQFKVLLKLCLKNKTLDMINSGIDFHTFWKGVPSMNGESEILVQKIFTVINERKSKYLSLDEFLKGMAQIRCTDVSEKIDMFFKIIDSNGKGILTFKDVYEISLLSLGRSIKSKTEADKEVLKDLAYYFADLIFSITEVDIKDQIPLSKIKEKILKGGKDGEYLEMFCCADWLKGKDNDTKGKR